MKSIRIGMIGTGFMGEAHSRGYKCAADRFDLHIQPALQAICGRNKENLLRVARKYGWKNSETDWHKLITREDVDLVDICVPNKMHKEVAIAAANAGKSVFCEKPLARNVSEAKEMLAAVQSSGVKHLVAFCNRKIPAIALAKELLDQSTLGTIFHWRATWRADWAVNPAQPRTWRFNQNEAGSGALGDIGSHLVDLARFLVGEIDSVMGMTATFVNSRPLPDNIEVLAPVDVDDAALFLVRFKNGAIGSFEASRFCTGEREHFSFEINGKKGSIKFDYNHLNKLYLWKRSSDPKLEGFQEITMDCVDHPYFPWNWGGGHGKTSYSDLFVNQAYTLLEGLASGEDLAPDFEDGLRCQAVLEAVLRSAEDKGRWVEIEELL